jgi:hypothetical protein
MTVAVAGSWELGYSAPLTELDLWQHLLREFNVDHWFMTPISGVRSELLTEYEQMEDIIKSWDHEIIFVDEAGEEFLQNFDHPDNVLYVLGKQSFSPFRAFGGRSVRVETPNDSGLLWPHQAISVVLYDRMVKSWPSQ